MNKDTTRGFLFLLVFWMLCLVFGRSTFLADNSKHSLPAWEVLGPFTIQERILLGFSLSMNRLDISDWEVLPKIGPKLAQNIVTYRNEKGPIQNVEKLLNVKGMGPKILENIRPFLIP